MFDGSSDGMEVETWLLDLNRCSSMHPYSSNTKAICVIMHLQDFALTWWQIECKLHIDIVTILWEMFLEHFHACFLSDHWR